MICAHELFSVCGVMQTSDLNRAQGDAVAVIVILIVLASIIYFAVVLFVELSSMLSNGTTQRRSKANKPKGQMTADMEMAMDTQLERSMNPMFTVTNTNVEDLNKLTAEAIMELELPPDEHAWPVIRDAYCSLYQQVDVLRTEISQIKTVQQRQTAGGVLQNAAAKMRRASKLRKSQFAPQKTLADGASGSSGISLMSNPLHAASRSPPNAIPERNSDDSSSPLSRLQDRDDCI